jgi:Predicted nucleic acid-binding protein, contains PIN domain
LRGLLVDSSVILDVFVNDPIWAHWSQSMLDHYSESRSLFINSIIYAEISIGFQYIEELEKAIIECGLQMLPLPREALFLSGKAYIQYRKRKGYKSSPLPDFFIGAHAAVANIDLLTRDVTRIKTYFPRVTIISPKNS